MANTFSLILVIVTLVTGIVWALEKLVLAKKRQEKLGAIEGQTNEGLDTSLQAKVAAQPWWVENSVSIFPVIAFVLVLRSFIYEPFQIPSGSMMPTLLVGDFILVEKYAYGLKDPVWRTQLVETGKPERGDIVVFKYPPNPGIDYIKRVVGLPGDVVRYSEKKELCVQRKGGSSCEAIELSNVQESIFKDERIGVPMIQMDEKLGEETHQILVHPLTRDDVRAYQPRPGVREWVVPQDQYFVMGDNRDNSADSRFWGFVPEGNLVGKAVGIWISFEFERDSDSVLPSWIPTGVRFSRVGGIH
ncbi:Signal peptidase I [Vibrio nigripulchritudo SFn27]|uniref:Signal peptidase I n=1 Tax=Vibrio nigripulchritudo TaxID=28173 RepID=U4KC87_9VIBR|nr:signal peptidase I [Vibrio nigripulchritudo]CCN83854.1 Signal peptidase I [Vibrio nigripulchritudo BLFn1]CCN91123.1 Signal peptidase I [Vibrio nigripulchritudo SFn27]CCN92674.1 Signal peptidase I [Vibrio nigripulchritudo ENn2]CCO43872.1 Signal peptidase I [Vibrio nigripulchritudo SFn135]CCO55538.1 Signal peptidase I [Vibrio nigripulchritudo Wn13]